jgi:hypothetical protein
MKDEEVIQIIKNETLSTEILFKYQAYFQP